MWLFRLELKRILKSRRTLILLAIALLLSVAMAYLPISFESINRPNEDGTVTELNGLAAIKYKQDLCKIIYVFLTIFLYLLKCPQSLILSALRAFCFCGKSHIPRSIFLYFRYQSWLKSW